MMNRIKQMYKDFFGYRLNEAAHVPYNIMDFAKNKGSYAVALVKKAATWAEKSGKRISGGTAIGKNYSTIILDMKHQGAEIYINLDNETIELYGEEVYDAKSFARVFKTMSDPNNIIFSINDEKLDDILRANHSRELEYKKDVTGDVYYILPIKEFDRFIDYADSAGYNVDYDNSEDSVIYVAGAETKLREQNTGTISTKDPKQAEELAKKVSALDISGPDVAKEAPQFLDRTFTLMKAAVEYLQKGNADAYNKQMAELMMNPGALAQFMTVGIPKNRTDEFVSSLMKLMDAPTRAAFIQSFVVPTAAKEVGNQPAMAE
jgi:hypothetical protein